MSLNQLTENYSDSDIEIDMERVKKPLSVSSESSHSDRKDSSRKGTPVHGPPPTKKRKVGRLVSYANDEDDAEEAIDDESDVSENEEEEEMKPEPMEMNSISTQDFTEKPAKRDLGIKLPAAPPGKCSTQLQDKVAHFLKKVQNENMDYNKYIQNNKAFRNPSIYEKLINHLSLDEQGSNYPLELFDPHCWGKESFYDTLSKSQMEDTGRREKERKERAKNDSGTKKPVEEEIKKRKSRFDQGVPTTAVLKSVPLPTVTTVNPGTKPNVGQFNVGKKK